MLPTTDPKTNAPYTIAKDGFQESLDTDTTEKIGSEIYIPRSGHYLVEVMTNLE